jgi:xylulokinase
MAHLADTLLGIDLGTTGVKAVLFNAENGEALSSAFCSYPLLHPRPGWAEQQPEDWWSATVQAMKTCVSGGRALGISAASVRGIGLSGQMHGVVLLDEHARVLRPAIIWADQRSEEECRQITEQVGASRLIELVSNPALTGFSLPKLIWIRNHEPGLFALGRTLLLPKDYIRYRLTGVLGMEISDAAGTCLLDVVHGRWSEELLALLDLDPGLLPPVIASDAVAGGLLPEVASQVDLLDGTPVAGGGADNACGAVGSGVVAAGLALVSIGTSGVVLVHSNRPLVDRSGPLPRVHTFNHAQPSAWYLMGVTQAAGLSLRWLRDNLGLPEMAVERFSGLDAYDLLDAEAGQAPAGSEGLQFLPYLQGERTPHLDAAARGGWIGLTASHTRRHLIRAVLEGVAYSLKDCFTIIQQQGSPIEQVRATGGGARSRLWRQIIADVLGIELVTTNSAEGPAFGAAILAGVASGVYPSVEEACRRVVTTLEHTEPEAAASGIYMKGYGVYQALYPALQPLFSRLS